MQREAQRGFDAEGSAAAQARLVIQVVVAAE